MGSCKNKRLIGPFLDGQLGECKWLEEHIAECSECLREYESVQRLSYLAEKADFPPPESSYWKKFGTRVIARIAARPQPKRYPRILESIFVSKLTLRLVTPLIVIMIAVLAVRLYIPPDRTISGDQPVANEAPAAPGLEFVVSAPADLARPAADASDDAGGLAPENSDGYVIPDIVQAPVAPETAEIAGESEPGVENVDRIIRSFVERNNLANARTRVTSLDNGLRADISQEFKFRVFDTEHVLRFQIITGSNPSLAPLSSYREAAGRFFAPEISNSRELFERDISNRWGYASGDKNYNEERQRHLELEFDLSREK